jgi:Tfp pilus assembly protein PilN
MMPARIELNFAKRQRRFPLVGALVLLLGCGAAYWTYTDYQGAMYESELLQISMSKYGRTLSTAEKAEGLDSLAKITAVTKPLSTPWTALLNDLEVAAEGSEKEIALLEVAPDLAKQQVRISAEARSLPAALEYVTLLQNAQTLRHPMLEKHEVQLADREHPVRFEVTAEWSLTQ